MQRRRQSGINKRKGLRHESNVSGTWPGPDPKHQISDGLMERGSVNGGLVGETSVRLLYDEDDHPESGNIQQADFVACKSPALNYLHKRRQTLSHGTNIALNETE